MAVQIIVVDMTGGEIPLHHKAVRSYFMKAKGVERAFFSAAELTIKEKKFECDDECKAVHLISMDEKIEADFVTLVFLNPAPSNQPRPTSEMIALEKRLVDIKHEVVMQMMVGENVIMHSGTDVIDIWYRIEGTLEIIPTIVV